jgi:hypothetical protein
MTGFNRLSVFHLTLTTEKNWKYHTKNPQNSKLAQKKLIPKWNKLKSSLQLVLHEAGRQRLS